MADNDGRNSPKKTLDRWLVGKQRDWARVIAARSALRTLPLVAPAALSLENERFRLVIWRANLVSWAARRYSAQDMTTHAARAADAAKRATSVTSASARAAAADAARAAAARAADADAAAADADAAARAADVCYAAESAADAAAAHLSIAPIHAFSASAANAASYAIRIGDEATQATFLAALWNAITWDVEFLERHTSPENAAQFLAEAPLWMQSDELQNGARNAVPDEITVALRALEADEFLATNGYDVWHRGYHSILNGSGHDGNWFGDELDVRIATQPDKWWQRGPKDVNAEISAWVEAHHEFDISAEIEKMKEAEETTGSGFVETSGPIPHSESIESSDWDFFISYSTRDELIAREIDSVLQNAGYSTYVQFRDFGVGSNLVREMQRGLIGAGQVIALYSPDYETSDHCQAEWSAAYNSDPSGGKRKLIPFLLRPTELNPLARQIVYKSLVGLDATARNAAVLEAVRYKAPKRKPKQILEAAKAVASPVIVPYKLGNKVKIDVAPNPEIDQVASHASLHELPELQRSVAQTIEASLPSNAPKLVGNALRAYHEHLLARGSQPFVGLLRQMAACIQKEVENKDDFGLWGPGLVDLFESFFKNHALFMAHFPLAEKRERLLSETPVRENEATGDALRAPIEEFVSAAEELSEVELTTEDFDQVVSAIRREAKDLSTIPLSVDNDQSSARITPKRRFIIGSVGFFERVYAFVGATASIAATPQGIALLAAIRSAIEKLMAFLI